MEPQTATACPQCGNMHISRFGKRYEDTCTIQRYICPECGRRFDDVNDRANFASQNKMRYNLDRLKLQASSIESDQLGAGAKKLETEHNGTIKAKSAPQEGKEKCAKTGTDIVIDDFCWYLKKQNYQDRTITGYYYNLRLLCKKGLNLFDPESFVELIAKSTWEENRKYTLAKAYQCFLNYQKIDYRLPKYKCKRQKTPYLPPIPDFITLFNCFSQQMACFCFTLKATAARPIEALRMKWDDIDFSAKKIGINDPAKGNNTRTVRVNDDLLDMLKNLRTNQKLQAIKEKKGIPNHVFSYKDYQYAEKGYRRMRQKAIQKTGNQELRKIHLYTCRHWRATDERNRKGGPDPVQYLLGHRSGMYVGLYAKLAIDYFGSVQEYDVQEADASDKPRIKYLLSQGYEDKLIGGVLYFRKPKE